MESSFDALARGPHSATVRRSWTLLSSLLVCGCVADGPEQLGAGSIAGSVADTNFTLVGASYRIGAPDDPARTLVVYVFDGEVACESLAKPGWDERVGDGVQSLEMKLVGDTVGAYEVVSGPSLASGQASVNYTLTSTSPMEISAVAGTVTLTAVGDDDASGEFDLMFSDGGALQGQFDAAPCSGGHEP